ncbi:hypothetical protein Tco_0360094 [Tanacetum coccineum]
MANLEFYDTNNMVAYLHKTEGSEGFHQIVHFLNTSHIKYALTENLIIHVSLIQQFWQTAVANTLNSGEVQITATIDGKVKLVSEASIRRHLKFEDSDGITTLPNMEIFEQLTLMGYASNSNKLTFQKGYFSPQWRFLIHTILHCLSPKKTAWEQFSRNIVTAIICLATNRTFNFSKMIFEGMVKNLDSKSKFLMYPRFIQIFLNQHKRHLLPHNRTYIAPILTQKLFSNMRRASKGYTGVAIPLFLTMLVQGPILQDKGSTVPETEVPQPSSPTYTNVADEATFTSVDVVHGGAATTISSIDAGQGSGNIPKSPTMPHDSPLQGGHTPGSDKGSMTLHELTVSCIKLSNKVDIMEIELKQTKQTYGADLTKPIKKLGILSAAKVLADAAKKNVNTYTRRKRAVSTGSEGVSTASRIFSTVEESVSIAGASMPVSTAGMVQQVNIIIPSSSETTETTKDKGKALMQESKQPKKIKKRVQIQMSLDEKLAQKLHEEEQARFNAEQEAKFNAEQEELLASETTEDEANPLIADIDWDNVQA